MTSYSEKKRILEIQEVVLPEHIHLHGDTLDTKTCDASDIQRWIAYLVRQTIQTVPHHVILERRKQNSFLTVRISTIPSDKVDSVLQKFDEHDIGYKGGIDDTVLVLDDEIHDDEEGL